MYNLLKNLTVGGGLLLGTVAASNAALLDFTDDSVGLDGQISGVSYMVTGFPVAPNRLQAFDGNPADVIGVELALDNDGIGVQDDEVTFPSEYIEITFGQDVTITDAYFLDLFVDPNDTLSRERALISVDGADPIFFQDGAQAKAGNNAGFADRVGELTGTVWRFMADEPNDGFGRPDYALAALNILPAPIPLPAAGLLLVGGLGALGAMRRRKS